MFSKKNIRESRLAKILVLNIDSNKGKKKRTRSALNVSYIFNMQLSSKVDKEKLGI